MQEYIRKHFIKARFKKVSYDEFFERYAGRLRYDIREVYTALTGRKPRKKAKGN